MQRKCKNKINTDFTYTRMHTAPNLSRILAMIQWQYVKTLRDQRLTYLFVHFNVQPIGHLIVLGGGGKQKKYKYIFPPFHSAYWNIIKYSHSTSEGCRVSFFFLKDEGVRERERFWWSLQTLSHCHFKSGPFTSLNQVRTRHPNESN